MTKKEKRFVEISEIELRKAFNEMLAEELNEKGYNVVFSKNTMKIVSIQPKTKDIVQHKFERLKIALKKKYKINIEYTDTYCLRSISFANTAPTETDNQTEQIAA